MWNFLAEPPWYIILLLFVIAAGLLFTSRGRTDRRLLPVAIILIAIAIGLYTCGYLLESGRERVIRLTKDFAAAVDQRNWTTFRSLLTDDAKLLTLAGGDQITEMAKSSVESSTVHDISLSGFTVKDEPGGYVVDFSASADVDASVQRTNTNWRFYWDESTGGQSPRVYQIEFVPSALATEEMVARRLRTR